MAVFLSDGIPLLLSVIMFPIFIRGNAGQDGFLVWQEGGTRGTICRSD